MTRSTSTVALNDVFILDAVRTPIGRYGGALSGVRPDDLAAHIIGELIRRSPEIDSGTIDDVVFGNANGSGEDNRNVARMGVLLAGLPVSTPGVSVNRLCGSGMEAAIEAYRAIAVGDASLCIAGGVESMSRAPWILPKPSRAFPAGHETLHSSTLGWRMVNDKMPVEWTGPLGDGAEILAERYGIDRRDQDAFALRSHQRAAQAWNDAVFENEITIVPGVDLKRDEGIRYDASLEALAKLRPAFRPDGTVTAGNASPLSDGAAALLIGDRSAADATGRAPLARVVARGIAAVEPPLYGIAPVRAAHQALDRAGLSWADIDIVELNEAFAAQSLACLAEWPDLDPSRVNPAGGAIAVGHPLGCSGARILGSLAWALNRRGGGRGLAAICIGVGQGLAVVLEA